MRFRTNSKQSPFLNRRHQRRLLMLFGLLVLVIASMRFAADPKTWDWIFANQNPPPAKTEQKSLPVAKSKTKAKPPVNLGPNEIRASASYAKTSKTDSAKTTTGQPSKTPARQAARKLKPGAVDLTVFPREMDDRELGITVNEFSAYLAVLAQAARTSPQELQPLVRKDGTYTVLINNADHFRGEAFRLPAGWGR